jgi:exosortase A-associated hydrolase 2
VRSSTLSPQDRLNALADASLQALFIHPRTRSAGQRFALYHEPSGPVRGSVLAVYPFAEEMNKSRRMIGLGARAMAAAGYAVLQIDLLGCGDSTGDLADATWEDWLDDIAESLDWLAQRHAAPLWLWGTRAGCLVAGDAARRSGRGFNFLFWQPQPSGKQVLQQFLRLKMASQMRQGSPKGLIDALQKELAAARPVEVAGYRLGSGLAKGLAASVLLPAPGGRYLCWLEVTAREPAQLLPATGPVVEAWRDAGFEVFTKAVPGPPFWQTLDIEDAPELVTATVRALDAYAETAQ